MLSARNSGDLQTDVRPVEDGGKDAGDPATGLVAALSHLAHEAARATSVYETDALLGEADAEGAGPAGPGVLLGL